VALGVVTNQGTANPRGGPVETPEDYRERFETSGIGQLSGSLAICPTGYELIERFVDPEGFARAPLQHGGELNVRLIVEAEFVVPRFYDAITCKGCRRLHRKFGKMAAGCSGASEVDILSFATRFGLLKGGIRVQEPGAPLPPDPLWPAWPARRADRLQDWIDLANTVGALLAFWDLCDPKHGVDALSPFVRRHPETGDWQVYFGWDGKRLTTSTDDSLRYRFIAPATLNPVDVVTGNISYGWQTVERSLRGQTLPSKLKTVGPAQRREAAQIAVYGQINAGLARNTMAYLDPLRRPQRALAMTPRNLMGAIWLHFALEVVGGVPALVQCANPGCTQTFPPRPGKRTCSPTCRKALWRIEHHNCNSDSLI
jgi:hypothetical protein